MCRGSSSLQLNCSYCLEQYICIDTEQHRSVLSITANLLVLCCNGKAYYLIFRLYLQSHKAGHPSAPGGSPCSCSRLPRQLCACHRQWPARGLWSICEGHKHGLSLRSEMLGLLKHIGVPLPPGLLRTSLRLLQPPSPAPLTAPARLPSLGGRGLPGCNPGMPEAWHLPLSCTAMKHNVNLDFLAPVLEFSVPTMAPAVCQKSHRNDSLLPGSHQSLADTRHTAASGPDSSSCKSLKVLCSHFCCF